MIPVEQIIAQYHQAVAQEERALAAQALEALEGDEYCNEISWQKISTFFQAQNFDARLEIITTRLISRNEKVSGKPILVLVGLLVKSGRLAEARPLLDVYQRNRQANSADQWQYVSLLYKLKLYGECLEEVEHTLQSAPDSFGYRVMEIRSLWRLRHESEARKKLDSLVPLLGNVAENWLWYLSITEETKDPTLARVSLEMLISRLSSGALPLTKQLVMVLKKARKEAILRTIIQNAEPGQYADLRDLEEIFECAAAFGFIKIAQKFGVVIMAKEETHRLKDRISSVTTQNDFMAF
jgi:hypothetical protein